MAVFETTRTVTGGDFFGTRLSSILASITAWNDARVTRNALSKLTDRELEDIGLQRSDINEIAARHLSH